MARKMNDGLYFRAIKRITERVEYWRHNLEVYKGMYDKEQDSLKKKEYEWQIERATNEMVRAIDRKNELYLAQLRDKSPRIEFQRVPMSLEAWLDQRTCTIGRRWKR